MGSIQALRSEALSYRSMSDTALEMSSFLAKTNKSLGSQTVRMLEQLQGVIDSRTQAYNGLVGKLNNGINGKGGIGERGINWVFSIVNLAIEIAGCIASVRDSESGQSSWSKVLTIASAAADVAKSITDAVGAKASLKSNYYDYEKLVSTLGLSSVDFQEGNLKDASTVNLLKIKDSLMPRYKCFDQNFSGEGYIGTRKRI